MHNNIRFYTECQLLGIILFHIFFQDPQKWTSLYLVFTTSNMTFVSTDMTFIGKWLSSTWLVCKRHFWFYTDAKGRSLWISIFDQHLAACHQLIAHLWKIWGIRNEQPFVSLIVFLSLVDRTRSKDLSPPRVAEWLCHNVANVKDKLMHFQNIFIYVAQSKR